MAERKKQGMFFAIKMVYCSPIIRYLIIENNQYLKGTLNDNDEKVEFETSSEIKVFPTFESMGLREELLRGVYEYGFDFAKFKQI